MAEPLLRYQPGAALLCFALLASSARATAADPALDDFGPAPEFALIERSEKTIRQSDLLGKIWVASFVFTRCNTSCPVISGAMAQLQKDLFGQPDVVLVSISVDPAHDTPEVMRRYAELYDADPERWLFLTGEPEPVYDLIRKGFFLTAEPNQGAARVPGNEVMHDERLVLVDAQGHIRGYFNGADPTTLPKLEDAILELVEQSQSWETRLPALNASLNATCVLLLSVGYLAIRRRQVALHKACMLAALCVSALFLTSYLYYHFAVKHGQPTSFTGVGWIRITYFAILISHTILAVVVAPLALFAAYQGLRNRLARHVRIARWTLPLWLYVSMTGVVVYWMLYRLAPSP